MKSQEEKAAIKAKNKPAADLIKAVVDKWKSQKKGRTDQEFCNKYLGGMDQNIFNRYKNGRVSAPDYVKDGIAKAGIELGFDKEAFGSGFASEEWRKDLSLLKQAEDFVKSGLNKVKIEIDDDFLLFFRNHFIDRFMNDEEFITSLGESGKELYYRGQYGNELYNRIETSEEEMDNFYKLLKDPYFEKNVPSPYFYRKQGSKRSKMFSFSDLEEISEIQKKAFDYIDLLVIKQNRDKVKKYRVFTATEKMIANGGVAPEDYIDTVTKYLLADEQKASLSSVVFEKASYRIADLIANIEVEKGIKEGLSKEEITPRIKKRINEIFSASFWERYSSEPDDLEAYILYCSKISETIESLKKELEQLQESPEEVKDNGEHQKN